MKVLGILGSPRIGGNTDILLEKALEGARSAGAEAEKVILSELDIAPCQEIEYTEVNEDGLSVVDDDIHVIFRKIKEADAIILSSPIFFGSLSAQAKIMIDRFQCVWVSKNLLKKDVFTDKKKGAFISVQATPREDFFENSRSIVRHFFATINTTYDGEVFCSSVDKKGSVSERIEFLDQAYEIGKKLVE